MIEVGISAMNRPYPVGVNLQVGSNVYADRGYTYTQVPSMVQGGSYIQTANNDKVQAGNPFLTFTLDQPSIVYVAHDVRISPKPSWLLGGFTDTGENLLTSDTTLRLFKKDFQVGVVNLGGNESGGCCSMYAVVVVRQSDPPSPFKTFDSTLYRDKPDLSAYGVMPMQNISAGNLTPSGWTQNQSLLPDRASVEMRASNLTQPIAFLDIEHWPLKGSHDVVVETIVKYLTVYVWAKAKRPDVQMGYYGRPPIRDYWRAVKGQDDPDYILWMVENDKFQLLADMMDVLYPSLYTFYDNQSGWVKYATANLSESRRMSKGRPVYAFLWPQYHDANATLKGQYLPADFWRLQLNTVKAHADGVVIWGGWSATGAAPWDDQAPWWIETKDFLNG